MHKMNPRAHPFHKFHSLFNATSQSQLWTPPHPCPSRPWPSVYHLKYSTCIHMLFTKSLSGQRGNQEANKLITSKDRWHTVLNYHIWIFINVLPMRCTHFQTVINLVGAVVCLNFDTHRLHYTKVKSYTNC